MNHNYNKISFIGGGNMARSIIGGLIKAGWPANHIAVSDPDLNQRTALAHQFDVTCFASNAEVIDTDIVILAVKPQILATILRPLAPQLKIKSPLLVSIAAGVRLAQIKHWSHIEQIVRVMPNSPALVSSAASGLFADASVSMAQKQSVESIVSAVGTVHWVNDEALLDTITAISGSGPAYFFLMMEVLEQCAIKAGLNVDTAQLLVIETVLGAARLAHESDTSLAKLRQQVTSPGGTTEAAINQMQSHDFSQIIQNAVHAAIKRSRKLGITLAQQDDLNN